MSDACGATYRKPSPGLFSYNSPIGACTHCRGFGRVIDVDWDKVVPDRRKSIAGGAIRPWTGKSTTYERKILERHCKRAGIPLEVPYAKLTKAQQQSLVEGDGGNWRTGFPGLRRWFKWMETRAYKMHVRVLLARYRTYQPCRDCGATGLQAAALIAARGHRRTGLAVLGHVRVDPEPIAFLLPSAAPGTVNSHHRIRRECPIRLGGGKPHRTVTRQ